MVLTTDSTKQRVYWRRKDVNDPSKSVYTGGQRIYTVKSSGGIGLPGGGVPGGSSSWSTNGKSDQIFTVEYDVTCPLELSVLPQIPEDIPKP